MSGAFTPGPWVWNGELSRVATLDSAHGRVIDCAAYEGMWFAQYNPVVDEANARLIAAAPDLLRCCEMAVDTLTVSCRPAGNPDVNDESEIHGMLKDLRAAITKATGEPA